MEGFAASTLEAKSSRVVVCCQGCDAADLEPVVFLGYLPPVNQMREVGAPLAEEPRFPTLVLRCLRCRLVQLGLVVDPGILFPATYPYTSGTTKLLRDNFAHLARECRTLVGIKPGDLIVDIGSNDGTLLSHFLPECRVLGVEPTDAAALALSRGIATLRMFFARETAEVIRREQGLARVVAATNVFAHIDDVHGALEGIAGVLDEEGLFVSESHYWPSLLERLQYDTIYHEHLRYYSLQSLQFLLERHGWRVIHAARIPTHGGSIRVYAVRSGRYPAQPSVERILREEARLRSDEAEGFQAFRSRVVGSKLALWELLHRVKGKGARLVGIGAPSRASTLLHYAGLDEGVLESVFEIQGSRKIGKYMPGTRIPVREESALFEEQPDYALVFSWHIADELIPKLRAQGYKGKFILPLPKPCVVS